MKENDANLARYRELIRQKRRLLDRMRKHRKSLAKDRVEKKKINEEITRLRKSGFAFAGMTTDAAKARVSSEIRAVKPEDIYPKDLEKKFDKLERTSDVKYRKGSVDISDINDDGIDGYSHVPSKMRLGGDDDGLHSVESGVLDMSEEDPEFVEPTDDSE